MKNEKTPILIATHRTPEMTSSGIITCFKHNPTNNLVFLIGSSLEEELKLIEKKLKFIKEIEFKLFLVEKKMYFHGDIINFLYQTEIREYFDKFILMDSDVYFQENGRIDEMLQRLDENNVFCVADSFSSDNYSVQNFWLANGTTLPELWYFQKRASPYFSLWKNDETFKKVFDFLNFHVVVHPYRFNSNKFFDTASVISNIMMFLNKYPIILETKKMIHMGGKSYIKITDEETQIIDANIKKVIKYH